MLIYFFALIGILLLFFALGDRKRLSNVALFISFLVLWVIATFRDVSVGIDTYPYYSFFKDVAGGNNDIIGGMSLWGLFVVDGFENGYKLYNYAISLFSSDFTLFLGISYAFIFYSFYRFIKVNSSNRLLSVAIYMSLFFFGSMNHFRQAIALAILTWGFTSIVQRKFFRYLLIVLLATLIHQASIIAIFAYFLYGRRLSFRNVSLYIISGGALALFINPLIHFIASSNPRYEVYIDKINSFNIGSYLTFIVYALLLVIIYYCYTRSRQKRLDSEKEKLYSFYIQTMLIAVLIAALAIIVSSLSRFISYFMVFSMLSIPNLLSSRDSVKFTRSITILLIIFLFLYIFTTMVLRPEWLGVSNYELIEKGRW